MSQTVAPPRVVNIADLRRLAERRLPRLAFDYIDGGADDEITLRENRRAFETVTFRPRSAVATTGADLRTTVLGTTLNLPFLLAPVGSSRLFYPRGEVAAAKAAGAAGTTYILSTLSGCRLEDVKAATSRPAWYQVYLVGGALAQSVVTWADMRWIRDLWKGPIVVKGVHTSEDARQALAAGAQALVVSNHGGRQLDGVPATLRVLPEVLEAVDGLAEVLVDGGIRRGGDVAKALCLGARAVLVGRAYAYGLAAAGEAGVARAIEILRTELVRTLKLLGCESTAALDRSYVNVPGDWK